MNLETLSRILLQIGLLVDWAAGKVRRLIKKFWFNTPILLFFSLLMSL